MKKWFLLILVSFYFIAAGAQSVPEKLKKAFRQFESDEQMKHGTSSLYVIEAGTGKVVFEQDSRVGMAPASTQKIITSVTAFELLGADYRYQTKFFLSNSGEFPSIIVRPSGDPTLGSWRWDPKGDSLQVQSLVKAIRDLGIDTLEHLLVDQAGWETETIPGGWIWEDIGNYYGAGAEGLIWHENQYDLFLKSGKNIGDPVEIMETSPFVYDLEFLCCHVTSAAPGTGDNAYIYYPLPWHYAVVRGTIPINENRFRISGSLPSGARQFHGTVSEALRRAGIRLQSIELWYNRDLHKTGDSLLDKKKEIHTIVSPPLHSLVYWFNRKSINLYGEALVKTMALRDRGLGSTDTGVSIIKKFWKEKGIDEGELNMYDGSGLSPLNRVTTHAQVEILKYAMEKEWYPAFYESLPEYNNMKMKSGTISDVKGFCGYHRAKNGISYIFSFLVNNYSGRSASIVAKMYKVLDELK
jgi:D-alanyl-D-alanine carboxypeptidase/D-alanyl-D-alanine-endopeptidase (penicillin-binding protein 4)